MTTPPTWPEAPGPRILTLVGNDLTIDVRARKTASSLARAGFSVISIGVDNAGTAPGPELLDGALLYRAVPPSDPRVSPRILRLSLAEIRERLRYRVEIRRQRLQVLRRNLTAWRHWNLRRITLMGECAGRLWVMGAYIVRVPDMRREELREKIVRRCSRYSIGMVLYLKRVRVLACQAEHATLKALFKTSAHSPRRTWRDGSWRRDLPELHRYEAGIGGLVDSLEPALIHVHDIFHLGLAIRAKLRAAAAGRKIAVVYDAHEMVAGLPIDKRRRAAYLDLEEEYMSEVDRVVTVSPGLAAWLHDRYGCEATLVFNAPDMDTAISTQPLRDVVEVPKGSKVVTYVGGIAPHRGAESLLEAMTLLPSHFRLVFVSATTTGYVAWLMQRAQEMSLGERVYLAPYVAPEAVVSYMRSTDVSVIPLARDIPNYEVALPNKLFQSIQAGVPLVVSDNPDMSEFVGEHGIGVVYREGDAQALAEAISHVVEHADRFVEALANPELRQATAWRSQAEKLFEVYKSVEVMAP